MTTEAGHPKLKENLQFSQVDGSTFELVHPETGGRLQLDSIGAQVAEYFEAGTSSPEEVQTRLLSELDQKVDLNQILDFLSRAEDLQMLERSLQDLGNRSRPLVTQFVSKSTTETSDELSNLRKNLIHIPFVNQYVTRKSLFLGVSAIVFFLVPWWRLQVAGNLEIKPFENFPVRSEVSGIVEQVFVREGEQVKKATPIVRLRGFEEEIKRKQSEVEKVDAELERLNVGATKEELNQLKKKLELTKQVAQQAREKANRYNELRTKGLVSSQEADSMEGEARIKEKAVEETEAELAALSRGTRPELIRAKRAEREGLLVDLKLSKELNIKSIISSPIDGVVATPDTNLLAGKNLSRGDFIMDISDPRKIMIELHIDEADISQVFLNLPIYFKVQSIPSQTFSARVTRIAPVAQVNGSSLSGPRYFRVYADLDNVEGRLMAGMTGVGKIRCGFSPILWTLFRHLIRYVRVTYVI